MSFRHVASIVNPGAADRSQRILHIGNAVNLCPESHDIMVRIIIHLFCYLNLDRTFMSQPALPTLPHSIPKYIMTDCCLIFCALHTKKTCNLHSSQLLVEMRSWIGRKKCWQHIAKGAWKKKKGKEMLPRGNKKKTQRWKERKRGVGIKRERQTDHCLF